MKDEIFYIYVDKTDDGRVFYVGKGKEERLRNTSNRNNRWKGIAAKYGQNREVVAGTRDEEFAFEMEKALIAEYKTFESKWAKGEGWGANFTDGGEGQSGRVGELAARYGKTHTDETKAKIGLTSAGENNPMYGMKGELSPRFGYKHSEETKAKMNQSHVGKKMSEESKRKLSILKTGTKHTEEAKRKVSEFNKGKIVSEETKKRLSEALMGHEVSDETRRKISAANTGRVQTDETKIKVSLASRGENNGVAVIKEYQVIEARMKYSTGNYTQQGLATEYGVSKGCMKHILTGRTWKHLLPSNVAKVA